MISKNSSMNTPTNDASFFYDLNKDDYLKYNPERCAERFIPASTFKIFNSLAALEAGAIKDENEIIKAIALPGDILLQARDHMGPVSILRGKNASEYVKFASSITLRYSDAPKGEQAAII